MKEESNLKSRIKGSGFFKAASIYAVTAWLIIQVVDILFPLFGFPLWIQKLVVVLIILGFPITLILVWVHQAGNKSAQVSVEGSEEEPVEEADGDSGDLQAAGPKRIINWKTGTIILAIGLLGSVVWQLNQKRVAGAGLLSEEIRTEKVAVSVFNNFTGEENLDALGNMASDWITSGLRELDVKTTSPETMRRYKDKVGILPGNANGDISLQEVTDASYVLTGSYYLKGDSLQINSMLESTISGDVVYEFPVIWGPRTKKEALIGEISEMMKGYWAVKSSNRLSYINPPKYEAYQLFLNIWMFDKNGLENVVRLDSTFILANIYLAYMYWTYEDSLNYENRIAYLKRNLDHCTEFEINYLAFVEFSVKGDQEGQLKAIKKNYLLDPSDIQMLHNTAYTYMEMNQLKAAAELYEKVLWDPDIPLANIGGNMRGAYMNILSKLGKYKKLLEFHRLRYEGIGAVNPNLARALLETGQRDTVISKLNQLNKANLLRLAHMYNELYPDDPENIYALLIRDNMDSYADPRRSRNYLMWSHMHQYNWDSKAYAYYLIRDFRKTEEILLELRDQQIDWVSYSNGKLDASLEKSLNWHMNVWLNYLLGAAYARQGKTELAMDQIQLLESYRASKPKMNNRFHYGEISYLQARIYSIVDEKELAVAALKQSLKEGKSMDYDSFWFDWDLTNLKGFEPYEEIIRPG